VKSKLIHIVAGLTVVAAPDVGKGFAMLAALERLTLLVIGELEPPRPQATITDPTLAADQSSLRGILIDPGMLTLGNEKITSVLRPVAKPARYLPNVTGITGQMHLLT
jgi:hypothetical protein